MAIDHDGITVDGRCRFCSSDVRGPEIPADQRHYYAPGSTHFSRVIMVEYGYDHPGRYDGASEFRCPDCEVGVNRWTGVVIPDGYYATRNGNFPMPKKAA